MNNALMAQAPNPVSLYRQAVVSYEEGKFKEVEELCLRILSVCPEYPQVWHLLGVTGFHFGNYRVSLDCVIRALSLEPGFGNALNSLGNILLKLKLFIDALKSYKRAQALNVDDALIFDNLATAFNNEGGRLFEAELLPQSLPYFFRALSLSPGYAEALFNVGSHHFNTGMTEQAIKYYSRSLAINADYLPARMGILIASFPLIYESAEHIGECRRTYTERLNEISGKIRLDTPERINSAVEGISNNSPFFLAYQCKNDVSLQKTFSSQAVRIMSAKFPQYMRRPAVPAVGHGGALRIGFVTGYMRLHSVCKLFRGWWENLDREKFELYCWHTQPVRDDYGNSSLAPFTRFTQCHESIDALCENVHKAGLHAIIYPEIGMDNLTYMAASMRLAPLQCVSWGHPQTTGLPTVDYFLSSELMEPENGDGHYSEKLVRLPNLSIYYTPLNMPKVEFTRRDMGFEDKDVLYWCCQSLYKYHPAYDEVFPRIAGRVPNAKFVFLAYKRGEKVNELFLRRLKKCFDRLGVPFGNRCFILPQTDNPTFAAMTRLTDAYLDSIGWSGGNTTLEAVEYDLPVVTMPGEFMRGRHTEAILERMGLGDLIAADLDEYVETAVRLGKDPVFRRAVADRIAAGKHRLYADIRCVRALENFLLDLIG